MGTKLNANITNSREEKFPFTKNSNYKKMIKLIGFCLNTLILAH